MKKLALLLPATLLTLVFNTAAVAEPIKIDREKLYSGGALNSNRVDSPFDGGASKTALGFSIFGGYMIDNNIDEVSTAIEVGYAQTRDFFKDTNNTDVRGLWVAGVAQKQLPEVDPGLSALLKAGVDFGDDDGILIGIGAAFKASKQIEGRLEFINKDALTVYQASAILHF